MLEIKNLTKIYKTKKEVETRALNNVSIRFPDKGMVFLLGKSGSGKSTLLNLCGGLDTPTSGEIIVKGRSSASFTKDDFDSYRNTFIGFIFQEYNILNNFTVEDNIAIALELQGKAKDKEKINELLSQVELSEYAKRKPNTLSGGQKQRIAIARALVKNPEIIMADEPTGALDSATGKQVFDTLKKLSEEKLVLVVSHDRDFAEQYGDRIIELKDGEIISDMVKTDEIQQVKGNVVAIDENTLSLKSGAVLDEKDMEYINTFLKNSKGEVLISSSEENIKNYKKSAKISENNVKGVFSETDESKITQKTYSKEETKLIKSKLPFGYAFRMGASNLKVKPFRLVMTIFLSFISFVLLGVMSTMSFYSRENVAAESLSGKNISYVSIKKGYKTVFIDDNSYENICDTNFDDDDIIKLNEKYGNNNIYYYDFSKSPEFGPNYYHGEDYRFYLSNIACTNDEYSYGSYRLKQGVKGFSYVENGHDIRNKIIAGKYPEKSDEFLISSYMFDVFKRSGYYDGTETTPVNEYNDLIGKEISFSNGLLDYKFKISGIYDSTGFIDQKTVDKYFNTDVKDRDDFELSRALKESVVNVLFVSEDFYSTYNDNRLISYSTGYGYVVINGYQTVSKILDIIDGKNIYGISGNNVTIDKNDNENVIISSSLFCGLVNNYIYENEELSNKYNDHVTDSDGTFSMSERVSHFLGGGYYDYDQQKNVVFSDSELLEKWNIILKFMSDNNIDKSFRNVKISAWDDGSWSNDNKPSDKNFNIVGVVIDASNSTIFMSKDNYLHFAKDYDSYKIYSSKYEINFNAKYCGAFINTTNNKSVYSDLANDNWNINEDDSVNKVNLEIIKYVEMTDNTISLLKKIFVWGGVVFALFSMLLLANFISVSISNKNKEIGILRAVGARGTDVFKIFFCESGLVIAICLLISLVGSFVLCGVLNNVFASALNGIRLMVMGLPTILIMLGISVVVLFGSTYLPVYMTAKKNPVDSIRKN